MRSAPRRGGCAAGGATSRAICLTCSCQFGRVGLRRVALADDPVQQRLSSSSLLPTCQYSEAAPAPSSWASLRMLSPDSPSRSSSFSAASTIASRVSGRRSPRPARRECATTGVPVRRSLTRTLYCARTVFEMTRTPFDQTNAIEAHGLVKTYPGDVRALDGLDLAVATGTVFGLLGPNGAGKSTTVRILTTLSRPDAGEARVAGLDVLADPVRVRHAIGVVGQKHGVDPRRHRPREPRHPERVLRDHRRGAAAPGRGVAGALRPR